MTFKKLTHLEEAVIIHKATEPPFSGKYVDYKLEGKYLCKQCQAELFTSKDKFDSKCGWPSFDQEIANSVKKVLDQDNKRTEILCANCGGHLGHVFYKEGFTDKNIRYCVNSISLDFKEDKKSIENLEKAYFAGGCFWGVEYFFQKEKGVNKVTSGYMGGNMDFPTYEQICSGGSGHVEVVEVIFNPTQTNFTKLCKLFFEIHDFTQINRQGPDIGLQYASMIFYNSEEQKRISLKLIETLHKKHYQIATKLQIADKFWPAESYHQNYYTKKAGKPYCHNYTKIFS
jgi:peptide methionine sulfoxide reductase msrA/msrB